MSSLDFPAPGEGDRIEAIVKWFNLSKGFGFVAPMDGSADAFMHVSVLTRAGLQQVTEGMKLSLVIGDGPKGRQVLQIIEFLGQGTLPPASVAGSGGFQRAPMPPPTGPVEEMAGTVKWFKPEKGFGFIAPDDGGKDVFVHKSVIGKLGLVTMDPGQRVKMDVHTSPKGREAVAIRLI